MKKKGLKGIWMGLALLLSIGMASTFGAEESSLQADCSSSGFELTLTEDFQDTKGVYFVSSEGEGIPGSGIYIAGMIYFPYTKEEIEEIDQLQGEEHDQKMVEIMDARNILLEVIAMNGSKDIEKELKSLGIQYKDQEVKEIAKADGFTFYRLDAPEFRDVSEYAPEYAQEFNALYEQMDQILAEGTYFAPESPLSKMIGKVVSFESTDLDGNKVSTQDLFAENEITIVNLWATWCPPCVGEMPELEKIYQRIKEKGCGVVGLQSEEGDDAPVDNGKRVIEESGVTYPNIFAVAEFLQEFNTGYFPSTYFVDSEGTILCEPVVGADIQSYERILDSLLEERKVPAKEEVA